MRSLKALLFRNIFVLPCLIFLGMCSESRADDAPAPVDASQIQKFSIEELHSLVAPVALYPDALLAQILPACAFPIQIVEAYRYAQTSATPATPPDNANWDSSVIALLHYPTVLKKLNDDPTWTDQLGVAATFQMDDVMQAIQQVRAEAQAVGNLQSNDKQVVEADQGAIQIVPADPQIIYVPDYDPVYICDRRLDNPFIWGTGFGFGIWLGNRWDWRNHRLWVTNRWDRGGWRSGGSPQSWRPPYRQIPAWYSKNGARRSGPAVPGGGFTSGGTARFDRVHPVVSRQYADVKTPVTSKIIAPSTNRFSMGEEEFGNRGHQTIVESNRGRVSREQAVVKAPVVHEPVVRAPGVHEPIVRAPLVHEPVVRAPVVRAPTIHEEVQHASDRGTVSRESSRGAASRGKR